jgi:hypothetical protein
MGFASWWSRAYVWIDARVQLPAALIRSRALRSATPPWVAPQARLPRHCGWRCTRAAGPAVSTWQPLPRHWQWRRTIICCATGNGAAKKGYSGKIVSPMVHFLNLFQVWVIFV